MTIAPAERTGTDAPTLTVAESRPEVLPGDVAIFDAPTTIPAIWGKDQEVVWASGEPLMICGPDGTGKSTLAQQLILARIGLRDELLSFPVEVADRPVLYIAADRPKQAMRSIRRMVADQDRETLHERLQVRDRPLPFDLSTARPDALASFAAEHGAGTLVIDSLKDVALDLAKDEAGSRVARAFQETIGAGFELCVTHHQRKEQQSAGKPTRLADVYGSRWLTSVAGSVVLLWGEPGDPVVDFAHLKQPAEDCGPFRVQHNQSTGSSTVYQPVDLVQLCYSSYGGVTALEAAQAVYEKERPTAAEKMKIYRRLERLGDSGQVYRDDLNGTAHYMAPK